MPPVPLLAICGMDGDAMSCECRKALNETHQHTWACVARAATTGKPYCIDSCLQSLRAALAAPCLCDLIDQHSVTCDCCDHVMIDVTAARAGGEQHCVAGDPEGDGMGCAHSWRETVVTLEAEGDQLRAKVEALEAALRAERDGLLELVGGIRSGYISRIVSTYRHA